MNILAHNFELAVLTFMSLKNITTKPTPMTVQDDLILVIWLIIFLLQGSFAMMPLFYNDENYIEILCEKIYLNFIII